MVLYVSRELDSYLLYQAGNKIVFTLKHHPTIEIKLTHTVGTLQSLHKHSPIAWKIPFVCLPKVRGVD